VITIYFINLNALIITMAEPFIGTMYAMTAVFAAAVAIWFSIRGYRVSRERVMEEYREHEKEEEGIA
jgi:heme O synthase-like polyprenyltransferase